MTTASEIVRGVGGPENIVALTYCATRLRFELHDAGLVNTEQIESIQGVMGAVPQAGDRYQVIVGGAVGTFYNEIMALPEMQKMGAGSSDADVKAAARSKTRGKVAWLDNFFEYLSDSFRPILGILLGASLIIAFAAVMDALGIVDFRAPDKSASWVFVDTMWRAVFYFLPIMIAYNAAKKLDVDPWVGAAVMGAMMTPEFISLSDTTRFPDTVCVTNATLGTQSCTADIFGIPMQLNEYGGQVFVPLLMVPILALASMAATLFIKPLPLRETLGTLEEQGRGLLDSTAMSSPDMERVLSSPEDYHLRSRERLMGAHLLMVAEQVGDANPILRDAVTEFGGGDSARGLQLLRSTGTMLLAQDPATIDAHEAFAVELSKRGKRAAMLSDELTDRLYQVSSRVAIELAQTPVKPHTRTVDGIDGAGLERAVWMLNSALVADLASRRWPEPGSAAGPGEPDRKV